MTEASATLSACGRYRYRLERSLGIGPTVVGIMVNPSTADANVNDPTIRRWLGFGKRLGWGRIVIVNKFAWRSPYVAHLGSVADPIGPENDFHITEAVRQADLVIAAWGSLSKLDASLQQRWKSVTAACDQLGAQVACWGTNADGHPKHPLMISYSSELVPWISPTQ